MNALGCVELGDARNRIVAVHTAHESALVLDRREFLLDALPDAADARRTRRIDLDADAGTEVILHEITRS